MVTSKSATAVLVVLVGLGPVAGAVAATPKPRVFKNCAALNKVYRGGVARPGARNEGGKVSYVPKYDRRLYEANTKSDRDRDGIACEQ